MITYFSYVCTKAFLFSTEGGHGLLAKGGLVGLPAEGCLGLPAEGGLGLPAEGGLGLPAEGGLGLPAEGGLGCQQKEAPTLRQLLYNHKASILFLFYLMITPV